MAVGNGHPLSFAFEYNSVIPAALRRPIKLFGTEDNPEVRGKWRHREREWET